jgi:integrase
MASVIYFIRTTTKNKPVNIRARLRDGRNVDLYANTRFTVLPENWVAKKETIKEVVDYDYRQNFSDFKNEIEKVIMEPANKEAMKEKEPHGCKNWLDYIIDKYHNPDKYNNKTTLFSFIQDFIDKAPTRTQQNGQPVCYRVQREYSRTFHYLKEFCEENNKEVDFDDIDLDFYEDFIAYLQKQKLAVNTIGSKIKTLKVFLNAAIDKGVNHNLKFKRKFHTITEESENIYLNEEELKRLWELDLSNKSRLERVRDLFLVGCFTGCRFSDIEQIKPKVIENGMINIKQKKTGAKVVIPVHPVVKSILEKHDGELPRIISNQKFNRYLKEVAEMAEINDKVEKSITIGIERKTETYKKYEMVRSHTARRSFATNLYKSGFPAQSIMKITGHKTEQAFLKYIKVTPEEHAEMLRAFWEKNGNFMNIAKEA